MEWEDGVWCGMCGGFRRGWGYHGMGLLRVQLVCGGIAVGWDCCGGGVAVGWGCCVVGLPWVRLLWDTM